MSSSNGASLPPGPRYPRALQTLGWLRRPMPFMDRCHARYGDMFTLRVAQEGTWVLVAHPDMVKQVFSGKPNVLHAGEGNHILLPLLGPSSLLLLDEQPHLTQRKLLLPPFHGERVQRYAAVMTEIAEAEIARWPVGEPMALAARMQTITLEVILRAVFGVREAEQLARLREVLVELLAFTSNASAMAAMAILGPRRVGLLPMLRSRLARIDAPILEEIRARRDVADLEDRDDVLSLLIQARHEDGSPMSDRELRDELLTLLIAGHETTATTLAWALERLVRHPDKLERLRGGDDEYMDAVIKETLRLRPVAPIVIRKLIEPMEVGGRLLPAGVAVVPCIHLIHRRPDLYPDPLAFRPERFLERAAGTYTWIPFGGGVRRCIGAAFAMFEMKQVLRAIVDDTELRSSRPESERVVRRAITFAPEHGAEMILVRRTL
jgi:cytochrome P450 family 135